MHPVLVIEEDPLIREMMREHLESEGYATCAVATVRVGIDAGRWSPFGLVLVDSASATLCAPGEIENLRSLGAPVVLLRSAPSSRVGGDEVEPVSWSPFDLTTLTRVVARYLPAPVRVPVAVDEPPRGTSSGTYATSDHSEAELVGHTTLPAPPEDGDRVDRVSLLALGELVLEATGGRRR